MISSGGTGGGSGLLTGMGTGSVAGEAGLIGPASCAGARIVAEVESTATPQEMVKMVARRFIVCSSNSNSFGCNPWPFCTVGSRLGRAHSVPQSELDRCSAWRGRGKRELNLGGKNLGNDDRVRGGPLHCERAAAGRPDLKTSDFRGNNDWAARGRKILAVRAGPGLGIWGGSRAGCRRDRTLPAEVRTSLLRGASRNGKHGDERLLRSQIIPGSGGGRRAQRDAVGGLDCFRRAEPQGFFDVKAHGRILMFAVRKLQARSLFFFDPRGTVGAVGCEISQCGDVCGNSLRRNQKVMQGASWRDEVVVC